jgi:triosephosphate isomerase
VTRAPFIAANWKMYKTVTEAVTFVDALPARAGAPDGVDVALCAPFTDLPALVERAAGSGIAIYAQNMHWEDSGAYTGEVSPSMLAELGVDGVILGHSERRALFAETDSALARKVPAALNAGLRPILCVGETEQEREQGETDRKLRRQVEEDLVGIPDERLAEVVIAYEPIWAIGTGNVATPAQAQETIAFVRALLAIRSPEQAERARVLYGGSVKPDNAADLLALPDIDGALVGGASLEPESFAAIVAAAPA